MQKKKVVVVFFPLFQSRAREKSLDDILCTACCGSFPFVHFAWRVNCARMHTYASVCLCRCEWWEFFDVRLFVLSPLYIFVSRQRNKRRSTKKNIGTNYNAPKETKKTKSRRESLYLWIKNNKTKERQQQQKQQQQKILYIFRKCIKKRRTQEIDKQIIKKINELQRKCYVRARYGRSIYICCFCCFVLLLFFCIHTHLLRCFALFFFLSHSQYTQMYALTNQKELTSIQRLEHIASQNSERK